MATTPAYERAKLQKRLRRQVGQAIADYAMIEAGDRVMVCLSGKDLYPSRYLTSASGDGAHRIRARGGEFDQKQPNFPEHVLPTYLEGLGPNITSSNRTPTAL